MPVIANPDRVAACRAYLRDHNEVDCILLDDGFQHRRLHRDFDIVLIDASAETLTDRLLPAGHLREPATNLARADAVVMTHADAVNNPLARAIERLHGRLPIAWSRHVWTGLQRHQSSGSQRLEVDWLAGKRVAAMLGVGNPHHVLKQLEHHGAHVVHHIPVRDHEPYNSITLRTARAACASLDALFVTGKDWVKLEHLLDLQDWPVAVIVPELAMDVFAGRDVLEAAVCTVGRGRRGLSNVVATELRS